MESESFVGSFSSIFVGKLEYYFLIVLNLCSVCQNKATVIS